jgi:DNA-binding GntR family transcriptional regulator
MCRSDSECDHGSVPADRPAVPPSKRVETDLRARIAANEWKSGERLPAVHVLAKEYGVAGSTVVAAERRIAEDGLIEIVPNWGVFRKLGFQSPNSKAAVVKSI